MRVKENEHTIRILNTEPGGKRERGRPRLRIEGVVEDLRMFGFKN